jgi:hypothetical protein
MSAQADAAGGKQSRRMSLVEAIANVAVGYLEGQDGVYIETRMGFDVDGVEIKARLDFGAKAIDWRGLFKNVGVAP